MNYSNYYMLHVWVLDDMKFIPDVFAGQIPCISGPGGSTTVHDNPDHPCHFGRTGATATASSTGPPGARRRASSSRRPRCAVTAWSALGHGRDRQLSQLPWEAVPPNVRGGTAARAVLVLVGGSGRRGSNPRPSAWEAAPTKRRPGNDPDDEPAFLATESGSSRARRFAFLSRTVGGIVWARIGPRARRVRTPVGAWQARPTRPSEPSLHGSTGMATTSA